MPLGMEVGLASTQAMLCSIGTQLPREKRHTHSHPIVTEVDLVNGHVVPAVHERGTAAPIFSPMAIVAMVTHLSYCLALVVH